MIDLSYFSFVLVVCALILIKRVIEFTYINIFHKEDLITYDMSIIDKNNTIYNTNNNYNSPELPHYEFY